MGVKYLLWNFLSKTTARMRGEKPQGVYCEILSAVNREGLRELQENLLKNLLLHAYHNVPYYNRVLSEINLIKNDEVDISQFSKIPLLTKEIIRNHHQELVSQDYTTRKWHYNTSGGSTGEPIRFIHDDMFTKWGRAATKYYYQEMLAIDQLEAKEAFLWGSERDLFSGGSSLKAKVVNWLTNRLFLNSFRMTQEDMERYVRAINSYKPDLMKGYAGSLYELCSYAAQENLSIHTPRIVVAE
ncbi:phenylacetate--CoA ligase family protein, partial [Chloroflexota bacterium]